MAKLRVLTASSSPVNQLPDTMLDMIFRAISSNESHRTRAHLYAVFSNYSQYIQELQSYPDRFSEISQRRDHKLVLYEGSKTPTSNHSFSPSLQKHALIQEKLAQYRQALFSKVALDALEGPTSFRALPFVFLTSACPKSWGSLFLQAQFVKKCFLQFEHREMQHALISTFIRSPANNIKYFAEFSNFEALLNFMTRFCAVDLSDGFDSRSNIRSGADLIVEADIFQQFSHHVFMLAFDRRDLRGAESRQSYLTSHVHRYFQTLTPVLKLIFSLHLHAQASESLNNETIEFLRYMKPVFANIVEDSVQGPENPQDVRLAHFLDALAAVQLLSAILHQLLKQPSGPAVQSFLEAEGGSSPIHKLLLQLPGYIQLAYDFRTRSEQKPSSHQSEEFFVVENLLYEVIRNSLGIAFELAHSQPSLDVVEYKSSRRAPHLNEGDRDHKRGEHLNLGELLEVLQLGIHFFESMFSEELFGKLQTVDSMSPAELIENGKQFGLSEMQHNRKFLLHKVLLKRWELHLLQSNCIWHCIETSLQLLFRHIDLYKSSRHVDNYKKREGESQILMTLVDFRRQGLPKLTNLQRVLSSSLSSSSPASSAARAWGSSKRRAHERGDETAFSLVLAGSHAGDQMRQERVNLANKATMRDRKAFIDKLIHRLNQFCED